MNNRDKINRKKYTMKLGDVLVRTDDEWLLYGQDILLSCIWKTFQSNWLIKFTNISVEEVVVNNFYAIVILILTIEYKSLCLSRLLQLNLSSNGSGFCLLPDPVSL